VRDLESKAWIVVKGVLFLFIAIAIASLLLMEAPTLRTAFLLGTLIWAACRFYYFLFYVLESYVDPTLRYQGLRSLIVEIYRRAI
jgi:hypothetical protein